MFKLWCYTALFLLIVHMPEKAFCKDQILIGLIPEENIFEQMDRHRPLADYLSAKLGIKVKLTMLSRYGDIIDRFTSRKMDGAFFGVFTGVLAMEKLGVEPVARPVNSDGSSTVSSYIIVRKDSGINGPSDMKGKRIIFVDRATVTGYLFGISFLKENGINDINRYFKEYSFSGNHASSIYAVLDNRADIAVVRSKSFQRIIEKDPAIANEIKIIARSSEFPDLTLCLSKDLPLQLKLKIKDILLNIHQDQEGKNVLNKLRATRFINADRKDFEPFFQIARKSGIDLKNYRYK